MPLTLIKRLIKGIKLTHQEMDDNFTAIEQAVNAKAESKHSHEMEDIIDLKTQLNSKLESSQKGTADGVATLDAEAKIPTGQIPTHNHSLNDIIDWSATNHTHPISQIEGLSNALSSKLDTSKVGTANGVASLDVNSKIPLGEIPNHTHEISSINELSNVLSSLQNDDINANRVHAKYVLTANLSALSTTRTNVSGWSFDVIQGSIYRIEIIADYQTVALTTGGSIGFLLNSGNGSIKGFVEMSVNNTPVATGLRTPIYAIDNNAGTNGSSCTSTGVGVINTPHSIYSVLMFKCTASGVFQVQWGTEVGGNAAQLNMDSLMIVTKY